MRISQKGLTLIEILIAIAILSFMALGIFRIVSQSSDTADRVTKEDDEFVQIVGALKRIDRDFSSIYSPLYFSPPMGSIENQGNSDYRDNAPDKLPINKKYQDHGLYDGTTEDGHPIPAIFYDKNKELIIFTSSHRRKYENDKESNFSWVRYFLSTNPDNSEVQNLFRQEISSNIYANELDWGKASAFAILENILKLDIFFWDPKKLEWSDRISEDSKYLGQAMKIELIWQDENKNENLVSKTYRILWPEFDPIADLRIKQSALKGSTNNTNGLQPNNTSDPIGIDEGFNED